MKYSCGSLNQRCRKIDPNSQEISLNLKIIDSNGDITDRSSSLVEDGAIGTEERVLHEVTPGAHGDADVKDLFESLELGFAFKISNFIIWKIIHKSLNFAQIRIRIRSSTGPLP